MLDMFNTKKAKETQEKLQRLESVKKNYGKLQSEIGGQKEEFDKLTEIVKEADESLNQNILELSETIETGRKKNTTLSEKAEGFAEKISAAIFVSKKKSEEEKALKEKFSELEETTETLRQIKKQHETLRKLLEEAEEKNKILAQAEEQSIKMQEAAQEMAALALNAAIEAGRMGESGMSFLHAAEDVRKMSEQYAEQAKALTDNISSWQTWREENKTHSEQAIEEAEKTADEAIASNVRLQEAAEQTETADVTSLLEAQKEEAEKIAASIAENGTYYEKAMDQIMNPLCTSYAKYRTGGHKMIEALTDFFEKCKE